jgi:hypothetical protein
VGEVLDVHPYLFTAADAAHGGHQAKRLIRLDHDVIPSTGSMAEVWHAHPPEGTAACL